GSFLALKPARPRLRRCRPRDPGAGDHLEQLLPHSRVVRARPLLETVARGWQTVGSTGHRNRRRSGINAPTMTESYGGSFGGFLLRVAAVRRFLRASGTAPE